MTCCGLYSRWNPSVISAHSLPPLLLCWPPEQPVGGEIVTFPQTLPLYRYSGVKSLWCFNTVGGEILTFPDTPTTQGLSLWCFNTVRDPRGQLTAVKGCRAVDQWVGTTSRAPTGGRVPSWGNLITSQSATTPPGDGGFPIVFGGDFLSDTYRVVS